MYMRHYLNEEESKDLEENKIGNYCVSLDEITKSVKRSAASLRKAKMYRARAFKGVQDWDNEIKEMKIKMKEDLILISELEIA
jgi:hypothetical protein